MAAALPVAWSEAATLLFTKSAPRTGAGQLWTVRTDGSGLRMLRTGMPVGPEGATATPARDGERVFCICRPGEIGSVDRRGRDLRRVGPQPPKTRYDIVTLSSSGRAFWVKRGNKIWTMKGDGPKQLVTWAKGSVVDERVVPSPGGGRLAFVRYGCLGPTCAAGQAIQIRTVRIDGGGSRTVYRSSDERREIFDLSWSADGDELIFLSATPFEKESTLPVESEYIVVGSDGAGPHPVAQAASPSITYPFLSPAGNRLAVTDYADDGYEQIALTALDGGSPQPVYSGSCRWPVCEFPPRVIGWLQAGGPPRR